MLVRLGSALGLLVGLVSLVLWLSAPRGIWAAEARTGFALDLPANPPAGLAFRSIEMVPSATGPSHVADLTYTGKGRARLELFESPYPLGAEPLKAGGGPVIIEKTVKGAPLLEGYERVGQTFVQADARGIGEPAFAASLTSLRSADGGLAYVLFHRLIR